MRHVPVEPPAGADPSGGCPLAWSEPLTEALISALPPTTLGSSFGASSDDPAELEELRALLRAEARDDPALRAWLWSRWRAEQRSLVEELDRMHSGRGRRDLTELLRLHGAQSVALAVLSEPGEEPSALIEESLARLRHAGDRKELAEAFERWLPATPAPAPIARRLIVIGGHPRERLRVETLLGPLTHELKWVPAVKGTGRGEAQLSLTAVSAGDTVLIVTGRVSHSIMHSARKAADDQGASCHFVEALTERQIHELLKQLKNRSGT